MSRVIGLGQHRFTQVTVMDEPAIGNKACHAYAIGRSEQRESEVSGEFGFVKFQNGPVGENGVNGCHQEDLLLIVADRLKCFQSGEFACRENALALTKIEEALHWLNHRTQDRQGRGVEGTNKN